MEKKPGSEGADRYNRSPGERSTAELVAQAEEDGEKGHNRVLENEHGDDAQDEARQARGRDERVLNEEKDDD